MKRLFFNIENNATSEHSDPLFEPKSPLKVLFTSISTAGAWQIRGKQIAYGRNNWKSINKPTIIDIYQCDLLCVIKKTTPSVIRWARLFGKPIVLDILDPWRQPSDDNDVVDIVHAAALFKKIFTTINANGYIFPNEKMRHDLGYLVEKSTTIYHHFWPHIKKNPIRQNFSNIGYQGNIDYLGELKHEIVKICEKHKINFLVNPSEYTDLDAVIIARSGLHASFLSNNYKSNVKLANAYGSGTPALANYKDYSSRETANESVFFFNDNIDTFQEQLALLASSHGLRRNIHKEFIDSSKKFTINEITNQFEKFFLEIHNPNLNK